MGCETPVTPWIHYDLVLKAAAPWTSTITHNHLPKCSDGQEEQRTGPSHSLMCVCACNRLEKVGFRKTTHSRRHI